MDVSVFNSPLTKIAGFDGKQEVLRLATHNIFGFSANWFIIPEFYGLCNILRPKTVSSLALEWSYKKVTIYYYYILNCWLLFVLWGC